MGDTREQATHPFSSVPERNTADVILRTAQQHHVQLSAMADLKANIIITVSSIVLTLTIGRLAGSVQSLAALVLVAFTLIALFTAILAILPKYRPLKVTHHSLPDQFNLLFFGHFAELDRQRFLVEIARRMATDGSVYDTMARDLYSLGHYLAHHKYRYLRLAYLFFLTGFVLASVVQMIEFARHTIAD